jgi:hypothetical protein
MKILKTVLLALAIAAFLVFGHMLIMGFVPGVMGLVACLFGSALVVWTCWQYASHARYENYVRFVMTIARAGTAPEVPRLRVWRLSAEEKLRHLRDPELRRWIIATCREFSISDLVVVRGIQRLRTLEFLDCRVLQEFERGNRELKEALAEALLAERILEYAIARQRQSIEPS